MFWLWAYPILVCLCAAAIVVLLVQWAQLEQSAQLEAQTDLRQEIEIHSLQSTVPTKLTFQAPNGVTYSCTRAAPQIYTCVTK